MIEHDTIELLRECDAGIKMGIESIDEVKEHVQNDEFYAKLSVHEHAYENLQHEIQTLLHKYNDEGKAPNLLAKGMSKAKTSFTLAVKESDASIADLMTEGCYLSVKSINRYLNQYKAANSTVKDIAERLIRLGEQQARDIRMYL